MTECQHEWEMTNINYGFIVFEKCSHCNGLRTYFSPMVVGEDYREDQCIWQCMENAQSFTFDLKCKKCQALEKYDNMMGFMYCTSCLPECHIEIKQQEYAKQKAWVIVAFGFLPVSDFNKFTDQRLQILEDYFNQRRDTSRSTIKVLSYELIEKFSLCKGEFIFDVGMLSLEPPKERKKLL